MTELLKPPAELTIIPEDSQGNYCDGTDCTIARALKRQGVIIDKVCGYHVTGFGGVKDSYNNVIGRYTWKDVDFSRATAHEVGTLVLMEVTE